MATFEILTGSNVIGGGGGSSSYLVATKTLTNDEVINLPTTYIEVIPAPGSGKMIQILAASLKLDSSAGAYGAIDSASYLLLTYGNWDVEASNLMVMSNGQDVYVANLIPSAYQTTNIGWETYLDGSNFGGFALKSRFENIPIKIACNNSGGAIMTGGNAANSLLVTIFYTEITL